MGGNQAMSSAGGIFILLSPPAPCPGIASMAGISFENRATDGFFLASESEKFSESRLVLRIELRFALHSRFCISSFSSSHVLF